MCKKIRIKDGFPIEGSHPVAQSKWNDGCIFTI